MKINFVIMSKYLDNVMAKCIVCIRTEVHKTDINLFFTISIRQKQLHFVKMQDENSRACLLIDNKN